MQNCKLVLPCCLGLNSTSQGWVPGLCFLNCWTPDKAFDVFLRPHPPGRSHSCPDGSPPVSQVAPDYSTRPLSGAMPQNASLVPNWVCGLCFCCSVLPSATVLAFEYHNFVFSFSLCPVP